MKPKIFSLTFDVERGRFDVEEIEAFCESVEIISHSEHFFVHDYAPRLLVFLWYRPRVEAQQAPKSIAKESDDPREGLVGEDKARYELLRAWRSDQSKAEKIAAFMVMTNRQLAEIARANPTTKAALQTIRGVGRVTVDKYSEAVLVCLREGKVESVKGVGTEAPLSESEPQGSEEKA